MSRSTISSADPISALREYLDKYFPTVRGPRRMPIGMIRDALACIPPNVSVERQAWAEALAEKAAIEGGVPWTHRPLVVKAFAATLLAVTAELEGK